MKKVSFLIFGFISLGLYFFAYDFNLSFNAHEVTQAQFFSATRPNWKIQTLNAKDSYELNSLKAFQEENKKVYLLDEPIFTSYCGIGVGKGKTSGNAFHWKYKFELSLFGKKIKVKFDDRMYLISKNVIINRARMYKYGIKLGTVNLYFHKIN